MLSLRNSGIGSLPRERVEVLGVFGSGKTTLAARLAASVGDLLAEDHRCNPFWGEEHALAVAGYLPYDLSFLIHHARLATSEADRPGLAICDWSFVTDRLWASMRLDEVFEAYDAVHRAMVARFGPARLYVHLDVPVDTILQRLASRGRPFEAEFGRYVEEATRRVNSVATALPTASVARVTSDEDFHDLVERVRSGGGRAAEDHERVRSHP